MIPALSLLLLQLMASAALAVASPLGNQSMSSELGLPATVVDGVRSCSLAVHQMDSAIAAIGAGAPKYHYSSIPQSIQQPFLPRNSVLVVILGAASVPSAATATQRSVDLMHSPQLQRRLASSVFHACAEIVKVSFTLANTDWSTSFFRGQGSTAIPARCLDPGPRTGEPGWGEEICL